MTRRPLSTGPTSTLPADTAPRAGTAAERAADRAALEDDQAQPVPHRQAGRRPLGTGPDATTP